MGLTSVLISLADYLKLLSIYYVTEFSVHLMVTVLAVNATKLVLCAHQIYKLVRVVMEITAVLLNFVTTIIIVLKILVQPAIIIFRAISVMDMLAAHHLNVLISTAGKTILARV